MRRLALFALMVFVIPVSARSQLPDTIRVGSVTLFALGEGVDTMDVAFEGPGANGAVDKRVSFSVMRRTREQLNGESVLHVQFGPDQSGQYDFYLDPRTLAPKKFEQHTRTDSAVVTFRGECASGWVDLQHAARRVITCDRASRHFPSSPVDDHLIALLPLKAGMHASLATYAATLGTFDAYTFSVTAAEPLQIGNRRIETWRVERVVVSPYGKYTTTLWIDQQKHRIVQAKRDFGNGRVSMATLRNP